MVDRPLKPLPEKRVLTALRIPPTARAEIDRRAKAVRLSRTEYMLRTALGEPLNPDSILTRLDKHEERLARLEELAYGN